MRYIIESYIIKQHPRNWGFLYWMLKEGQPHFGDLETWQHPSAESKWKKNQGWGLSFGFSNPMSISQDLSWELVGNPSFPNLGWDAWPWTVSCVDIELLGSSCRRCLDWKASFWMRRCANIRPEVWGEKGWGWRSKVLCDWGVLGILELWIWSEIRSIQKRKMEILRWRILLI